MVAVPVAGDAARTRVREEANQALGGVGRVDRNLLLPHQPQQWPLALLAGCWLLRLMLYCDVLWRTAAASTVTGVRGEGDCVSCRRGRQGRFTVWQDAFITMINMRQRKREESEDV